MTMSATTGQLWLSEAELGDVVGDVMLSLAVEPATASMRAGDDDVSTVSGCVSITGAWTGSVVLTCSQALGRTVTAQMLGLPVEDLSEDDVSDAVGELANMVGGSVKARAPEPSALSLPVVAQGSGFRITVPGAEPLVSLDSTWGNEPMRVEVLAHHDARTENDTAHRAGPGSRAEQEK